MTKLDNWLKAYNLFIYFLILECETRQSKEVSKTKFESAYFIGVSHKAWIISVQEEKSIFSCMWQFDVRYVENFQFYSIIIINATFTGYVYE